MRRAKTKGADLPWSTLAIRDLAEVFSELVDAEKTEAASGVLLAISVLRCRMLGRGLVEANLEPGDTARWLADFLEAAAARARGSR